MHQHEFELRYKAFSGLSERFDLDRDETTIFSLITKSGEGDLEKKVQDCSIQELWDATEATYTQEKKEFLQQASKTTLPTDKSLDEYIERLEYELKVIDEMGYNTYFLIVQDYILRARDNKIVVGPGRGSVAGCLLSYLIGITDIDPLVYDLIFERFLNPGRISMPDIDTDFEDTQRDRVIDYISETYGEEKVAHIGTYMTLAAKAAFKDVARVIGLPFQQSNKISGLITESTIPKSVEENSDFKEAIDSDERIKNIVRIAQKMEGTVRQTGVHACGMIISPQPVTIYSPIQHPPKSGSKNKRDMSRVVSQYDGDAIETIGLLKMDMLGLRNLSIIKNCIKIINAKSKKEGKELDPLFKKFNKTMYFHPPLDDELTYEKIFQQGDTSGVFQFESDGMKNWMKKLQPNVFDDLIAMVALYRPGPMEFIPDYIHRKHGDEKIRYMPQELFQEMKQIYDEETAQAEKEKLKEELSPFLKITYGIAIYQEQLMRLVQAMAGFSMSEADKLRKGVGKKIRAVIEKIKVDFIKKAVEHGGYKKETATWVYEKMIEPAADYSFNKSHAACYAYIAFQTAYLKAHYPVEFNAALLRSVEEDTDKLAKFVDELKLQGYKIKLPDINTSFEHVAAIDDAIWLGFRSIKGIGGEIAQYIEEEREANGPYDSLTDFLKRSTGHLNKKSLDSLIKSGALDRFADRFQLLANIQRMLDRIKSAEKHQQAGGGLFAMKDIGGTEMVLDETTADHDKLDYLRTEYDVFKALISQHPFDGLYAFLRGKYNFVSMIKSTDSFGEFHVIGFVKSINRGMKGGFFVKLEDISGEMEFFLQEKLDLQLFDILSIKGYKGMRSPKVDQIIVHELDELITKAKRNKQYNQDETVAQVRKERFANNGSSDNKNNNNSSTKKSPTKKKKQTKKSTRKNGSVDSSSTSTTKFNAPDNIALLAKIPAIIKAHPGDVPVEIGDLEASVSPEGAQQIRDLLA